jgi:hypothetical protein
MPAPARSPLIARLATRLAGKQSADHRDINARLDRALLARSGDADAGLTAAAPQPVQVVGEAHTDPVSYRRWRARQLRSLPGAMVPELQQGEWALVLWVLRPALLVDFVRHGKTRGLLRPPLVGRFAPAVQPEDALAGTLAAWLELHDGPLQLAPPLLRTADGPCQLAALGRAWPLPRTELWETAALG